MTQANWEKMDITAARAVKSYVVLMLSCLFWPLAFYVIWKMSPKRAIATGHVASHLVFQSRTAKIYLFGSAALWAIGAVIVSIMIANETIDRDVMRLLAWPNYALIAWLLVRSISGLYRLRHDRPIDSPQTLTL